MHVTTLKARLTFTLLILQINNMSPGADGVCLVFDQSDFDHTPEEHLSMDHYIKPLCVVDLVKVLYKLPAGALWENWAVDNPDKAAMYFTPPYPYAATATLGYSQPDSFIAVGDNAIGAFASMFNLPPEDNKQQAMNTLHMNERAKQQNLHGSTL